MGNRTNYKRKHAVERSMPLGPAYGSGCVTRLDRDAPLFAFLRQRTGTIVGAAIAHFLCNVWLIILEYSLY